MVQKSGRAPPWQCIKPVVNNRIKLLWYHSTGKFTRFLNHQLAQLKPCLRLRYRTASPMCRGCYQGYAVASLFFNKKSVANVVNLVELTRNCWEIGSTKWKFMSCHARFALGYFFWLCFLNAFWTSPSWLELPISYKWGSLRKFTANKLTIILWHHHQEDPDREVRQFDPRWWML